MNLEAILKQMNAKPGKLDPAMRRFLLIEKKQDELNRQHINLVKRVDGVEKQLRCPSEATNKSVDKILHEFREELQEERRKIQRLCNIVLMGVPETIDGLD